MMSSFRSSCLRLNFILKPWYKVNPLQKCCQSCRPAAYAAKYSSIALSNNNNGTIEGLRWPRIKTTDLNLNRTSGVIFVTWDQTARQFSSNPQESKQKEDLQPDPLPEKLNLYQRFKRMMKDYWYVVIPVHIVTSTFWFGSFFYAAKCGFDIVPYLEYFNISETIIRPFRSSSLGHLALAYALYKVATPARYTVTLGGTTFAIRFLTKRGLIKPMPSRENLKAMVKQKRDEFQQRNK